MAAYAARGGMRSLVLVPEGKISWSKLSQALDYGAVTCQLRTDFDGCLRLLQELVLRAPVYQLNSINPFRLEGQKTLAIELLEQLDWQPPDHIIVPGGNLGNSSAIGKALLEMRELGLISRLPKLSVIQAEGANALVRTLREAGGKRLISVQAETRATAIRIGNPASWKKAVHVLEATGGACEQVSEVEIAQAKAEIGAEGIGCEPASAVTLAGLKKLVKQGFVKPDETVVLVLTGNLLKDPDFTIDFHRGDLFKGQECPSARGLVTASADRSGCHTGCGDPDAGASGEDVVALPRQRQGCRRYDEVAMPSKTSLRRRSRLRLALPPRRPISARPSTPLRWRWISTSRSMRGRPTSFPSLRPAATAKSAENSKITSSSIRIEKCSKRTRKALTPLSLRIANDIPIGKGCGSSAAARLAGIALAVHFGGSALDRRADRRRGLAPRASSRQRLGLLDGRPDRRPHVRRSGGSGREHPSEREVAALAGDSRAEPFHRRGARRASGAVFARRCRHQHAEFHAAAGGVYSRTP